MLKTTGQAIEVAKKISVEKRDYYDGLYHFVKSIADKLFKKNMSVSFYLSQVNSLNREVVESYDGVLNVA